MTGKTDEESHAHAYVDRCQWGFVCGVIGVNVRFVDSSVSVVQPYSVLWLMELSLSDENGSYILGKAQLDEMNAVPSQPGILYYLSFRNDLSDFCYITVEREGKPLPSPVTPNEIISLWAHVAAHETGHMLGLVAHELLGGSTGLHANHNQGPHTKSLMDPGDLYSLHDKMGRGGVTWNIYPLNAKYLRFILPKQEEVSP